ncbi:MULTISPECIES: hypothetical protein [Citrobacter]|uniref:hypothetical protein n=1 Tax=Citrobacter TaxID=544 RepID=UPI0015EA1332|nr:MULTISPECIES: hypothetical protein [Citrobacter]MBJ8997837.1 hypothetical protein [Citrobacter braakii]MDM3453726.1 hypothetical protein [Citrobacter sp. Cb028]QLW39593.1 hypothetical protein HV229_03495 [Citrobacter sp. RHBSTW-00524]HEF0011001.1 hypothetical protein [Citrobacter braakii]
MMKLQRNSFFFLLRCSIVIFFIFFNGKPHSEDNAMVIGNEYFFTETPLIIHDYRGSEYSILPAGVALYPIVDGYKHENGYVIYINYQSLPGELETISDNAGSDIISELYLSKPPADFKTENNKVLTRNDLVHLLKRSTLTKKDFAEVISKFEE